MRAPKHCSFAGCRNLVVARSRCDEHSGWKTSPRTASSARTNTAHWKQQRAKALHRDNGTCQIRGPRCTIVATQVDHRISVENGGTDDLSNLDSACAQCHNDKTQREAAQARNRWKRSPEPHPGLIT
ncbi:HNH endonuclease [Mycobacterium riyadhense]|uniref:HNH endonuclease n=1 Tax=Mycobacterium riyadhense TaxID=486698 RepID=UPI001EF9CDD2|nr:HNH endonuclease [Mycobacterium riyadhense]